MNIFIKRFAELNYFLFSLFSFACFLISQI